MKGLNFKYVYVVSGWTNHDVDTRKLEKGYSMVRKPGPGRPSYNIENRSVQKNPPCRIIIAEQKLTKGSAFFSSLLQLHLNLIEITKQNKKK